MEPPQGVKPLQISQHVTQKRGGYHVIQKQGSRYVCQRSLKNVPILLGGECAENGVSGLIASTSGGKVR